MNVDFPTGPVVVACVCAALSVGWLLLRSEFPHDRSLAGTAILGLSFLTPFLAWTMVVALPMRRAVVGYLAIAGFGVDVTPGTPNLVLVAHVLLTYGPPFVLGMFSMLAISRLRDTSAANLNIS